MIGISSDVLYPLEMQKELVRQLPNATLRVVLSSEGHDGFLLEHGPIGDLIREALDAPVAPDALVEKHVDQTLLRTFSPRRSDSRRTRTRVQGEGSARPRIRADAAIEDRFGLHQAPFDARNTRPAAYERITLPPNPRTLPSVLVVSELCPRCA